MLLLMLLLLMLLLRRRSRKPLLLIYKPLQGCRPQGQPHVIAGRELSKEVGHRSPDEGRLGWVVMACVGVLCVCFATIAGHGLPAQPPRSPPPQAHQPGAHQHTVTHWNAHQRTPNTSTRCWPVRSSQGEPTHTSLREPRGWRRTTCNGGARGMRARAEHKDRWHRLLRHTSAAQRGILVLMSCRSFQRTQVVSVS